MREVGRSARGKQLLVALVFFGAITVYMLYPVSLHPGAFINGRTFEDAFEYVWYLDWYHEALFELQVSPLHQPDIFYPGGWNLGFSAFPPIYPTLLSPLTALVGAVTAYNLTLMGTLMFAAVGAYLLARRLGSNVWGGMLAGLAFAFYPHREVYLGGHLNFLMGSMWLPWILMAVYRTGKPGSSRVRWISFSAFAYAMSIAGSWHFLLISTTAVGIFALIYLGPKVKREGMAWLRPLGAAATTVAIIIGPFLIYAAIARAELGGSAVFNFVDTNASGVSLERFFVPSAINPLFWELARETFPLTNGINGVVNFGYVVILLAAAGVLIGQIGRQEKGALAAVAGAGLLLMLGLTVRWWGTSLSMALPANEWVQAAAPELVQADGRVMIPAPAFFVYTLLPPFRSFHAFGRWGLIVAVVAAPLAGLGLSAVQARLRGPIATAAVGVAALLLLTVEFNMQPLPTLTSIEEMQRDVDRWLAAQPEQSVIIEYPLWYSMKGQTLYYSTIHDQKMVHGATSIRPQSYETQRPVLEQWPEDEALNLLAELEVRYVLVHVFEEDEAFEEERLPTLVAKERLRMVRHFEDGVAPVRSIYLFELLPPA